MINFVTPFGIDRDREKFVKAINRQAGKGNWYWVFRVGERLYSHELGMQLYEDAYWVYLRKQVGLLKQIMKHYDVYVHNRHDLDSKLSYKKQEHPFYEHYADIAIRRCMRRYGAWFIGKELYGLKDSPLDDSEVPFHLPHLVNNPEKTAKAWLDSNRFIAIVKEIEDKAKLSEMLVL